MARPLSVSVSATLALASAALAAAAATAAPPPPASFSVFGYLPEWRYSGANFDALFAHLSHLAFFSAEPHPDGSGRLSGLDRLPPATALADAHAAAARHGTRLLLCLGGNGRSAGFGPTARRKTPRARLAKAVAELVVDKGLDGVDLNWEYPGYDFGSGYRDDAAVKADWDALAALVADVRAALHAAGRAPGGGRDLVTVAYYPDGRQERELAARGLDGSAPAGGGADLLHAMSYDARGAQHSPMSLAEGVPQLAADAGLRAARVTLGLPFYGRDARTGADWTSYEDIVQALAPRGLRAGEDQGDLGGDKGLVGFNGAATIAAKVRLAIESGLGGVMVWESGQDCREAPVTRDGTTHVRTCPEVSAAAAAELGGAKGAASWSLHAAVSRALRDAGVPRSFSKEGVAAEKAAAAAARRAEERAESNAIEL